MTVKGNASKKYPNSGQYNEGLGKVAENHINNKTNPHSVTAEQIGAAKKEHVHDAAYEILVETTLEQLDTAEQAELEGTVVGNTWQNDALGGLDIYVSGKVSFDVIENVNAVIFIDGNKLEADSFDGYVESKIYLSPAEMGSASLTFGTIKVAQYTGGVVSSEQANKLINTKVFTEDEKKKLKDTQSFTLAEKNALARLDKITDAGYTLVGKTPVELLNEGKLIADTSVTTVGNTYIRYGTNVTINVGEVIYFTAYNNSNTKVMVDGKELLISNNRVEYEGFAEVIEITHETKLTLSQIAVKVAGEYNGGYMAGNHVKELKKATSRTESLEKEMKDVSTENERQQTEIDSLKIETDEKYDKAESDILLGAYSIELKKTVSLTGDELTDKTSDYIHVSKITNNNAVEFGKAFDYSGTQYFGYVGVKSAAVKSGINYIMLAEVDIETELDIGGIQVSGFYRPSGGTGADDTSLNVILGKLKQGKNYILYPFTASGNDIDGFYMDSRTAGTNEVKFTLQDVRLYKRTSVTAILDTTGLKDWKCEILTQGNTIVSEIGDYMLYQDGKRLSAYSLSGALDAEVVLYKPLEDVFPTKEAFEALSGIVGGKGLVYEHYEAGQKCVLEKGCFYYLRNNSSQNKSFDWYKQDGTTLADSDGNDLASFKEAFVITTSNNYLGSHMNIALIPSTLSITSKAFYIDVNYPDIYVLSSTDSLSVWKVKP